jgi:hypothetical protein
MKVQIQNISTFRELTWQRGKIENKSIAIFATFSPAIQPN